MAQRQRSRPVTTCSLHRDQGRALPSEGRAMNAIRHVEDVAEKEKRWELANPEYDMDGAKKYGATKAPEEYQNNITYFGQLAGFAELGNLPPKTLGSARLRNKCITHAPDTPEDSQHRPQALWSRSYSSHDPNSPHVCPSKEGYWDTSFHSSWQYTISQCRILLCYWDVVSDLIVYRDLNAGTVDGPDRGMESEAVNRLIVLISICLRPQDDEARAEWLNYFRYNANDLFIVVKTHL
jgi:hypothetical protein